MMRLVPTSREWTVTWLGPLYKLCESRNSGRIFSPDRLGKDLVLEELTTEVAKLLETGGGIGIHCE